MDSQNGRLAERYQELATDFRNRSLKTLLNITAKSVVSGTTPVFGYLVQEQLIDPASRIAVVAGALAVTGTSLRAAYRSVDLESLLHAEYRHFKDLSGVTAGEAARPE